MDLRQLHYFLTIVQEEQITAAAKKLHMAQPPLSQQMKLLENELGVILFKRGPHHIELTPAGKALAKRSRQLLELADSTKREVSDFQHGMRGTLSIGTVSSSGSVLLHPGMQKFRQAYPDVHFEIHDGNTYQLLELMDQDIIEIGIVRTPFQTNRFHVHTFAPEPMIATVHKDFDWCPEKTHVTLAEIAAKPLIIYRRFNEVIKDVFETHGLVPNLYCRNDDARTTILWANAGMGIAVTPASALGLAAHENLHVKVIDEPRLVTQIAFIWPKNRYLSNVAQNFLTALKEGDNHHDE